MMGRGKGGFMRDKTGYFIRSFRVQMNEPGINRI